MIKIHKNFIKDKKIFNFIKNFFLHHTPHFFGETSNPSHKKCFYKSDLNMQEPLNKLLAWLVCSSISDSMLLKRMYLNIQHVGMPGEWHRDDCDITGLLMICGSGSFEIKNEKKYTFEENKLILFPGSLIHKGNEPNKKSPRITLALKMDKQ